MANTPAENEGVLKELLNQLLRNGTTFDSYHRIFKNSNNNDSDIEDTFDKLYDYNVDLPDESFILEDCIDEFELFKHYYEKMIETETLGSVIDIVQTFFKRNKITQNGCTLAGTDITVNQNVVLCPLTLPELEGTSSTIANASMKIELMSNGSEDNLTAVDNISGGEALIVEKPLVFTKCVNCVCQNGYYYECNHCCRPITSFLVCKTCDVAIYCSPRCRKEALNRYHYWECKAVKTHFFNKSDISHLAFRMLLLGSLHKFNTHEYKLPSSGINEYKLLYDMKISLGLFKLSERRKILRRVVQILVYLIEHTSFFTYLTFEKIFHGTTLYEKYLHVGGILVRHCCQTAHHALYFNEEEYSFTVNTNGCNSINPAIYLSSSYLKHSCEPNAHIILRRNICIVKAIRKIGVGEKITVDQFSLDNIWTYKTRRDFLRNRKITCTCKKCRNPWNYKYGDVLYKCPNCQGYMSRISTTWKCFICEETVNNGEMEAKLCVVNNLFTSILIGRYCSAKDMKNFIVKYPEMYYNVSLEYLNVCLQYIWAILKQGDHMNATKLGFSFIELLSITLHKYSWNHLVFLTEMVNGFIIFALKAEYDREYITCFALWGADELLKIANFYCFKEESQLLCSFVQYLHQFLSDRLHNYPEPMECHPTEELSNNDSLATESVKNEIGITSVIAQNVVIPDRRVRNNVDVDEDTNKTFFTDLWKK